MQPILRHQKARREWLQKEKVLHTLARYGDTDMMNAVLARVSRSDVCLMEKCDAAGLTPLDHLCVMHGIDRVGRLLPDFPERLLKGLKERWGEKGGAQIPQVSAPSAAGGKTERENAPVRVASQPRQIPNADGEKVRAS